MRTEIWLDRNVYSRVDVRRITGENPDTVFAPVLTVFQDGKGDLIVTYNCNTVFSEKEYNSNSGGVPDEKSSIGL